jgi:hypothetical protein
MLAVEMEYLGPDPPSEKLQSQDLVPPNPIFQMQGVGLDVDLRDGIFQRMLQLELATELLGLLTINPVLQPGAVLLNPMSWLWSVLMEEVVP